MSEVPLYLGSDLCDYKAARRGNWLTKPFRKHIIVVFRLNPFSHAIGSVFEVAWRQIRGSSLFENTDLTQMCSGSEAGSYLRLIDLAYRSTLGLRVIKQK